MNLLSVIDFHSSSVGLPLSDVVMDFRSGRRRGEEGIAVVIDFLLTNARLVLGVGGAALLGIATLVVKRVSVRVSYISHGGFIH